MRASRSFGTWLTTARALLPVLRDEFVQRRSPENERIKFRRAGMVVADAMPGRVLPRVCELDVGIDSIYIRDLIRGGQFQLAAKQPFVQEPDPARVEAGRLLPHELYDVSFGDGEEEPLQNREIEALVLEGKGQVSLKRGLRRMARRVDAPGALFDEAVLRGSPKGSGEAGQAACRRGSGGVAHRNGGFG